MILRTTHMITSTLFVSKLSLSAGIFLVLYSLKLSFRDNVVCLPKQLAQSFGNMSQVCVPSHNKDRDKTKKGSLFCCIKQVLADCGVSSSFECDYTHRSSHFANVRCPGNYFLEGTIRNSLQSKDAHFSTSFFHAHQHTFPLIQFQSKGKTWRINVVDKENLEKGISTESDSTKTVFIYCGVIVSSCFFFSVPGPATN